MAVGNLKKSVVLAAEKHVSEFEKIIGGFEDRGILNSEMLAVCSLSEDLGAEVIIESGRWKGQSTEILARYFARKGVIVESIELYRDENATYVEEKMRGKENIQLNYGNANTLVTLLLKKHPGRKVVILFDGPKGREAVDIFRMALSTTASVLAGFFHDMRRPTAAMPNNSRQALLSFFPEAFFTDDEDFVRRFSFLDDNCQNELWKPHAIDGKPIGSYGPTLGIVLPQSADRERATKDILWLRTLATRREIFTQGIHLYHFFRDLFTAR